MDNKLATIKERILQIVESKGVKRVDFCREIGISTANLRGSAKNTAVDSDTVANILWLYQDISPDWLISGQGEMLRSDLTAATDAKDKPTTTEQIAMAMETLVESNKILSESNLKLAEVNTRLVAILDKKEKQ